MLQVVVSLLCRLLLGLRDALLFVCLRCSVVLVHPVAQVLVHAVTHHTVLLCQDVQLRNQRGFASAFRAYASNGEYGCGRMGVQTKVERSTVRVQDLGLRGRRNWCGCR